MPSSYRTGYCPTCEAEREILRTVDWQEDTCVVCGQPVE